jgi:hypothetical protein
VPEENYETHREVDNVEQAALDKTRGALLLNIKEDFERLPDSLDLTKDSAFSGTHGEISLWGVVGKIWWSNNKKTSHFI